jgi:hypothetical protein
MSIPQYATSVIQLLSIYTKVKIQNCYFKPKLKIVFRELTKMKNLISKN